MMKYNYLASLFWVALYLHCRYFGDPEEIAKVAAAEAHVKSKVVDN